MMLARDLAGYGSSPPDPRWPGGARVAVQFVLNIEEGAESYILNGDVRSEAYLHELPGRPPREAERDLHQRVGVVRVELEREPEPPSRGVELAPVEVHAPQDELRDVVGLVERDGPVVCRLVVGGHGVTRMRRVTQYAPYSRDARSSTTLPPGTSRRTNVEQPCRPQQQTSMSTKISCAHC